MSQIKEILCMHHSHLDIGYTHPQNMLLELQCDYLEQAIDLCEITKDYPDSSRFCWTCEATYPLLKWLETASPKRIALFRELVARGQMSITALPMHTTPGCTSFQLSQALSTLNTIRTLTGSSVSTAINHDVNGQPWTLSSFMLDSHIEFYMTGINIHMGGIPFPRPYLFEWETPDKRRLPTFLGEHYSLFSQFLFTAENDTQKMHKGITDYVSRLESGSWNYDFAVLTATNPPLFDNNCPDHNLADLIRRYNGEGHEQTIRFITPEMLYQRLYGSHIQNVPVHRGDWNDYWNFGSGSTARETKLNRRAKQLLRKADFLECVSPSSSDAHYQKVHAESYENALLYDEHTWGSCTSVTEFDQEETYAQEIHKKDFAYRCADTSAYLLSQQMEAAACNPAQSDSQDGIFLVNPTGFPVDQDLYVPSSYLQPVRTLSAVRAKSYLPYDTNHPDQTYLGNVTVPPFSSMKVPFKSIPALSRKADTITITDTIITTPFYKVTLDPETKRIKQIENRSNKQQLIDETSRWVFFDIIKEQIDPAQADPERSTIFPRDVDLGNRNISQWATGWPALYENTSFLFDTKITCEDDKVTLAYELQGCGLDNIHQTISFSANHPRILLDAVFSNKNGRTPHGIFFAFPLNLSKDWDCVYDTADTFVHFDTDILGSACRDWITVDKTVSVFEKGRGVTLACPDAPLIQVGGFHFGREEKEMKRSKNPLLLAWPMNNYWDTNFAIQQTGKIHFHYELTALETFTSERAYELGMLANSPCVTGSAIHCQNTQITQYLSCDNPCVYPIYLQPIRGTTDILAAIKNFNDMPCDCTITLPGLSITAAACCDIQGEPTKFLETANNKSVKVPVLPSGIAFIRFYKES